MAPANRKRGVSGRAPRCQPDCSRRDPRSGTAPACRRRRMQPPAPIAGRQRGTRSCLGLLCSQRLCGRHCTTGTATRTFQWSSITTVSACPAIAPQRSRGSARGHARDNRCGRPPFARGRPRNEQRSKQRGRERRVTGRRPVRRTTVLRRRNPPRSRRRDCKRLRLGLWAALQTHASAVRQAEYRFLLHSSPHKVFELLEHGRQVLAAETDAHALLAGLHVIVHRRRQEQHVARCAQAFAE